MHARLTNIFLFYPGEPTLVYELYLLPGPTPAKDVLLLKLSGQAITDKGSVVLRRLPRSPQADAAPAREVRKVEIMVIARDGKPLRYHLAYNGEAPYRDDQALTRDQVVKRLTSRLNRLTGQLAPFEIELVLSQEEVDADRVVGLISEIKQAEALAGMVKAVQIRVVDKK